MPPLLRSVEEEHRLLKKLFPICSTGSATQMYKVVLNSMFWPRKGKADSPFDPDALRYRDKRENACRDEGKWKNVVISSICSYSDKIVTFFMKEYCDRIDVNPHWWEHNILYERMLWSHQ